MEAFKANQQATYNLVQTLSTTVVCLCVVRETGEVLLRIVVILTSRSFKAKFIIARSTMKAISTKVGRRIKWTTREEGKLRCVIVGKWRCEQNEESVAVQAYRNFNATYDNIVFISRDAYMTINESFRTELHKLLTGRRISEMRPILTRVAARLALVYLLPASQE